MSTRIRLEEYTTLGDFIKTSFVRDQAAIALKFPKLNAAFMTAFTAKLAEVKVLESSLVQNEQQKAVTASLFAEAFAVSKELNFLSSYIADAGLNNKEVIALKADLVKDNIEGAVLKMEAIKQFINANKTALIAEGMAATYPAAFDAHKTSLAAKNTSQNSVMNTKKTLTSANRAQYEALYVYIAKIAKNGKLVFDGAVTMDEYNIKKIIGRMRAAEHKKSDDDTPPDAH